MTGDGTRPTLPAARHSTPSGPVRRLRGRLNLTLLVGLLPIPAWILATVWVATSLVSARAAPWITAVAAAASAAWITRAFRAQAWTDTQAAVSLDRLAEAGGLLLTLRELPDAQWDESLRQRLQQARLPPLALGRPLAFTAAAGALVVAAAFLPHPEHLVPPVQQAAQRDVEALAEQTKQLAEEGPLPTEWAKELERLRADAQGARFDAADWETVDSLKEAANALGQSRMEALQRAADAAARLEDALEKSADAEAQSRERDALESALAALGNGESGQAAGREGKSADGPKPGNTPQTTKAGEKGTKGAGQGKEKGAGKQGAGGQGGTRTASELKELQKALHDRQKKLAQQFRGSGKPSPSRSGNASADGNGKAFGSGGAAHGRAPKALLDFGEETKFQKDRLRFAPMPDAPGQKEPGALWGLVSSRPTEGHAGRVSAPVGVSSGDESAPGARGAPPPPRHRDLVQRYFSPTTPDAPHGE